jgi:hypothetical protein
MKKLVKTMVEGVEKEIEIEVPDEPETKQNASAGLFAKKLLIKKSKLFSDEDVDRCNSIEDADLLLKEVKEIEKLNAAVTAEPNKPKGSVGNIKTLPKNNPDPRLNAKPMLDGVMEPYSAEELLDPLQTDNSRLNRHHDNPDVRILRIYDADHLEGRII